MIKFRLDKICYDRHISQRQLSRETGIRHQTIGRICNNKIELLPVYAIDRICSALSLSPADWMEWVEDEQIASAK